MDSQPPPESTPIPVSDIITTAWPRRAAKNATKACASCRRDKIRCDGAKPCGGCIKKGHTIDQCIDGCEGCRKARVRCEGGKPCRRCRDMEQECVEEQVTAGMRTDVAPPVFVLRNRQKSERAKLACQSCRRDNKKCDDQRPCSRCIGRGEECVHVGRGPKLVKLRCEGCRLENRKCEDSRPCGQCVEQGRECVSMQRKGRGHGTRVKAACATCRRDKVRCDGTRPCSTCARKGYQCVDRVCALCVQQSVEGECPHRPKQATDASDRHLDAEAQPSGMPVSQGLASAMFAYGSHPYQNHMLSGPSTGYPRAPYYPAIDPQIELNMSSER